MVFDFFNMPASLKQVYHEKELSGCKKISWQQSDIPKLPIDPSAGGQKILKQGLLICVNKLYIRNKINSNEKDVHGSRLVDNPVCTRVKGTN